MKAILLATVAAAIGIAFESETSEVVLINGPDGNPVRVNKSDFDADQESDNPQFTAYSGDPGEAEDAQPVPASGGLVMGGPPLAAPSAPDFTGGTEAPTARDPLKDAAAPVAHGENARLVLKKGSKYYVVDGAGETIKMDGLDPGGYKSEEAAWTAIRALPH